MTLFQQLTTFTPRNFQQQTITHILKHQNIILRSPTGSGKTETAVAPFLFAKTLKIDFPQKLIYVLPLRTLANSLRQRTTTLIQRWSKFYPQTRTPVVTLQTGDNPEDPRFEGDIVFCTIDQMLSSCLNIPYSVGRGSANVNAGAIFASYLVFDEIHLLDADRSFATVLKILQQLQDISPFLLMTATLTDELANFMQQEIVNTIHSATETEKAKIIRVDETDLTAISGNRHRKIQAVTQPLTAEIILQDIQQNQRQRVIIICNTVSHAQNLFQKLRDLDSDIDLEITLLHSRFLPEDRAEKETELKISFAENWQNDGICRILIATQVIEAGINITCEVMHLQLSPMNSLLQRVGRCARFRGETGEVFVYRKVGVDDQELETEIAGETPKKRRQFLPYKDDICELTWSVLLNHTNSNNAGANVDFRTEESWINQIHTEETLQEIERRANNRANFEQQFNAAIFRGDRSTADDLIRDVDNRNLFVWEEPIFIDQAQIDPKKLLAFSVPISTLNKVWREYSQLEYRSDWIFKRIETPKDKDIESYCMPVCIPITSWSTLASSFQILVNPRYISYDDEVGLLLGMEIIGNSFESPQRLKKTIPSEYRYQMDTYVGHLVLMGKCWRENFIAQQWQNGELVKVKLGSVREELLGVGSKLIQRRIFPQMSQVVAEALFEFLVLLAIFTHDLGKLQVKWQQVMQGWQAIAHSQFQGKYLGERLIAHTDYNPEDEAQKLALKVYEKQYKRPNHAIEGAFLAQYILLKSLVPWLQKHGVTEKQDLQKIAMTVVMAAGRHHSAWSRGWELKDVRRVKEIRLRKEAGEVMEASWRYLVKFMPEILPQKIAVLEKEVYLVQELDLNYFEPQSMAFQQLYSLVVRGLRLCDGRSVIRS